MAGIYDHEKLCLHKKKQIPHNIIQGQIINKFLKQIPQALLIQACQYLKSEYKSTNDQMLDTEQKKSHAINVLGKIEIGKYDFVKKNIQEGEKLNIFYEDIQIELPTQQKNYHCEYCNMRSFKKNSALYSHFRSCLEKRKQDEEKENMSGRPRGFKRIREEKMEQEPIKIKKLNVDIICLDNKVFEKKEEMKDESKKRQKPCSTLSLGFDIFYGDE